MQIQAQSLALCSLVRIKFHTQAERLQLPNNFDMTVHASSSYFHTNRNAHGHLCLNTRKAHQPERALRMSKHKSPPLTNLSLAFFSLSLPSPWIYLSVLLPPPPCPTLSSSEFIFPPLVKSRRSACRSRNKSREKFKRLCCTRLIVRDHIPDSRLLPISCCIITHTLDMLWPLH